MAVNLTELDDLGTNLGKGVDTILENSSQGYQVQVKRAVEGQAIKSTIFQSFDVNHLASWFKTQGNNVQANFDTSVTVPIGTAKFNFGASKDLKTQSETLRFNISWGIRRHELKYVPDTTLSKISLSEDARDTLLKQGLPIFVREYGDSFISKVVLGARWDAAVSFSFDSQDKKNTYNSKLQLEETAKGVINLMTSIDGGSYFNSSGITVGIEVSKVGGLKIPFDKKIETQQANIRKLQEVKNLAETNLKNKMDEVKKADENVSGLKKEMDKAQQERDAIKVTAEKNTNNATKAKENADRLNAIVADASINGLAGDELTKASKAAKDADDANNVASLASTKAKAELEKKEKNYTQAVTNLEAGQKVLDKLKEESKSLDAKYKQIASETKENIDLLEALKKKDLESSAASSSITSFLLGENNSKTASKVMKQKEFIDYYNDTLKEINEIKSRPTDYIFDPIEQEITRYYTIVGDRRISESMYSVSKAAKTAVDIMNLINKCDRDINRKLAYLRDTGNPSTRGREVIEEIHKLEKNQNEIDEIRRNFKDSSCIESSGQLSVPLNKLKEIVKALNDLDENLVIKNAVAKGELVKVFTSTQIHDNGDKKELVGSFYRHHWRESAFLISTIDKESTQIRIELDETYWGRLKFGYKIGNSNFESLPLINVAGEARDFIDAEPKAIEAPKAADALKVGAPGGAEAPKAGTPGKKLSFHYTITPEIRAKLLNENFKFGFLHACVTDGTKPSTKFSAKVFVISERPKLSDNCVDSYLSLDNDFFKTLSPSNRGTAGGGSDNKGAPDPSSSNKSVSVNPAATTAVAATAADIVKKPPLIFSDTLPKPPVLKPTLVTEGQGDCAFHATFGEWDSALQKIFCKDVKERRKRMADAVRGIARGSDLLPFVVEAIRDLLMQNSNCFESLRDEYRTHLQKNSTAIDAAWQKLETELSKQKEIIDYINDKSGGKNDLSNLRSKFQFCLNVENGTLYGLIESISSLSISFAEYNKASNDAFKLEDRILREVSDKKILEEYAGYIEKMGQYLLPCELKIIAHVFDINIKYNTFNPYNGKYTVPEDFNSNSRNYIGVCFNGFGHYERTATVPLEPSKDSIPTETSSSLKPATK